jgi:hypothetical protein
LIRQDLGDHAPRFCDALGEGEAAVKQQPANLTDDGGAVIDHPLPGAMQSLDILLLDGLLGDEGDMRLTRCRADGFRVIAVVLLPPHEGLHILGADQLDLMSKRFEFAGPIECARAGFNHDRAAIDPSYDREKLIPHHAALQNNAAIPIDAMKLEHILGDVHAEGFDRHSWLSFQLQALSLRAEGRAVHPISWSKDFLEAGKKRLAGDTTRAATSDEVKDLRREASALKEVVAELILENRLLKKSVTGDGEDEGWDTPLRETGNHPIGRAIAAAGQAYTGEARHPEGHVLSLWTALPLQVDFKKSA